ncbi:MAG TPA: hydrogenase expression/formation protein HypE [Acidobacteriota bacterium]|nr:hydrogenase expression/formation protein HypE [Acidobacteriota bacterium]
MPFECPLPVQDYESVTLGHGGGGRLMQDLINGVLLPALSNPTLDELHDGAILPLNGGGRLALSTDSFVVDPPFFPGGDIGSLSVHGTANDLAMCGARPLYLTLSLILEEGFEFERLARVTQSIKRACDEIGVQVLAGDTKVVERGKGDGIFINTTGIGEVLEGAEISARRIRPGDKLIVSGGLAEHGIAILSKREGLSFESEILSDSAALWPLVKAALEAAGRGIHALRDATRGGAAAVLNELAASSACGVVVDEHAVPVREDVKGACEMLGLDPLYVANEGKFLAFVSAQRAEQVLEAMRAHSLGRHARIIGEAVGEHPGVVRLRTGLGGTRVLDMLSGEQLPRIC